MLQKLIRFAKLAVGRSWAILQVIIMGGWAVFTSEFRWKHLTHAHNNPRLFSISQWQNPHRVSVAYLYYRLFWAFFAVGSLVASFLCWGGGYWFIYLTDLGFLALTLHLILHAVVVIQHLFDERNGVEFRLSPLLKFAWFISNSATPIALVISLIYWIFLYGTMPMSYAGMNAIAHGVNSFIVLLDIFTSASPFRLLHFYQPLLCLVAYVLFSVIYYFAGGTTADGSRAIYPILDWDNVGYTLIFVFGGFFVFPLFYMAVWLLHQLRLYIAARHAHKAQRDLIGFVNHGLA